MINNDYLSSKIVPSCKHAATTYQTDAEQRGRVTLG